LVFKGRSKIEKTMEEQILIVDDEKMIYSVIAQRLAKEGYACVIANNGREPLVIFIRIISP
jgi:DNA-binding response OmpR family regulator